MDFILFIKVAFHALSNRTNHSPESSFDIPKYLYALSKLTLALIRVHKIKSHRIHSSRRVRFKSKTRETRYGNFS